MSYGKQFPFSFISDQIVKGDEMSYKIFKYGGKAKASDNERQ